jgi:hypothetical protein
MKKSMVMVLAAAALLVGSAFAASASTVGTKAAVTPALAAYFSSNGVDAAYLDVAPSSIPADVMSKINDILTRADDTVNAVLYHTDLTALVNAALASAVTADYSPVYLELGRTVYQAEQGQNPSTMTAAQIAATPSVLSFVPLN